MDNISEWVKWLPIVIAGIGTILNVKKIRACWILYSLSNVSLCMYNFYIFEMQQGVLFGFMLCFSIWGWFKWK